jgi:rhamnosyltransferase
MVDFNQKVRVAAIIVAYKPSADFASRALAVSSQVDRVWVIDNADLRSYPGYAMLDGTNITHVRSGENIGLAAAQNVGVDLADGEGFQWILLLDQDTELPSTFAGVAENAIAKADADPTIALFAPEYEDHGVRYKKAGDGYNAIQFAIASGALVRTSSYRSVGGMDARLFIDYVDYDFCFKLTLNHFRLLSLPVTIRHTVGNLTKHRLLFWQVTTSNHAPRRLFSAGRNLTILTRRYLGHRLVLLFLFWGVEFRRLMLIGIFESHARQKTTAFVRGVIEGIRYGDRRDVASSIYYGNGYVVE